MRSSTAVLDPRIPLAFVLLAAAAGCGAPAAIRSPGADLDPARLPDSAATRAAPGRDARAPHSTARHAAAPAQTAPPPTMAPPQPAPPSDATPEAPRSRVPTVTSTPAGTRAGRPDHDIELSGLPAIAGDGRTFLVEAHTEYEDPAIAVLSVDGMRALERVSLPGNAADLPRRLGRVERWVARGAYRSLIEIAVDSAPTADGTERTVAGADDEAQCAPPCARYRGGVLEIRSAAGAPAIEVRAPRRRLLGGGEGAPCVPGGAPELPFGARVWIDDASPAVLIAFRYEAFAHGCELGDVYLSRP
jgi:hypothetical protein